MHLFIKLLAYWLRWLDSGSSALMENTNLLLQGQVNKYKIFSRMDSRMRIIYLLHCELIKGISLKFLEGNQIYETSEDGRRIQSHIVTLKSNMRTEI